MLVVFLQSQNSSDIPSWIQAWGALAGAMGLIWTLYLQRKATKAQIEATTAQIEALKIQKIQFLRENEPILKVEIITDTHDLTKESILRILVEKNSAHKISIFINEPGMIEIVNVEKDFLITKPIDLYIETSFDFRLKVDVNKVDRWCNFNKIDIEDYSFELYIHYSSWTGEYFYQPYIARLYKNIIIPKMPSVSALRK